MAASKRDVRCSLPSCKTSDCRGRSVRRSKLARILVDLQSRTPAWAGRASASSVPRSKCGSRDPRHREQNFNHSIYLS